MDTARKIDELLAENRRLTREMAIPDIEEAPWQELAKELHADLQMMKMEHDLEKLGLCSVVGRAMRAMNTGC